MFSKEIGFVLLGAEGARTSSTCNFSYFSPFISSQNRSIDLTWTRRSRRLVNLCIADSIFNTLGRACFSIEHRPRWKKIFVEWRCNYNETIKSRKVVWREWILPEGRRCFLKLFVFLSLEILERKKYITMFVQLKWYETDLGQNFEE